MNPEQLIQKIEGLEKQLPRWEKWLFVCYGAAFTFLATSIIRAVEQAYLVKAFFSEYEVSLPSFPDSFWENIGKSNSPWWTLVWLIILLVTLFPGILLSAHSSWRKVPLTRRFNLIFGYFYAAWIALLSISIQLWYRYDPKYILLLAGSIIAIRVAYWWLRKRQAKAEEVFP